MATATTQRKNMIGRLKKNKHAARAARTKEKILYRPLQNNNAKFKSQCRNISRISNQFRKNQILAYTTQTFLWYNYFKKWYEENPKRFTFGEL